MKKYFIITNGTTLVEKEILVDKNGLKVLNEIYDALDECYLNANYALCDNRKQVNNLIKKWGFSE